MGTVAKRRVLGAAAHAVRLTFRNLLHDIGINEILVGKAHGALLLKFANFFEILSYAKTGIMSIGLRNSRGIFAV